jgi:hypothetical protein
VPEQAYDAVRFSIAEPLAVPAHLYSEAAIEVPQAWVTGA